jgi:hypothetical protein
MGIVAKILWRLRAGPDRRLRLEGGLFARAAGAQELGVAIASISRAGMGGIPGRRE